MWTNTKYSPTANMVFPARQSCESNWSHWYMSYPKHRTKEHRQTRSSSTFPRCLTVFRINASFRNSITTRSMDTMIADFFTDRRQNVIIEGVTSDSAPVVSGVPLGSVLGPLLFLLFINDLPDNLTSQTRHFADDCIVYRTVRNQEDCMLLQQDLYKLAEWEHRLGMEFHTQKCSVLSVTRPRSRSTIKHPYKLKGYTLEAQEST